jgi:hypothetical protein
VGVCALCAPVGSCGDSRGSCKLVAHREARTKAEGAEDFKVFSIRLSMEIAHILLTLKAFEGDLKVGTGFETPTVSPVSCQRPLAANSVR